MNPVPEHLAPNPVLCERYRTDAAFRARHDLVEREILRLDAMMKAAGLTAPKPLAVLPCLHRGSPAPPPDGKPTNKAWVTCDHPEQPLGPAVCFCAGCGPRCRGYEADREP